MLSSDIGVPPSQIVSPKQPIDKLTPRTAIPGEAAQVRKRDKSEPVRKRCTRT
jgi:hypothetical protein